MSKKRGSYHTSYFDGSDLHVGYNTTDSTSGIYLYGDNHTLRGSYVFDGNEARLSGYNSTNSWQLDTLNLKGNPVKINGVDIQNDNLSSEVTSISLPYTATRSGFMCFGINPLSVSGGYSTFKIGIFSAQLSAYNGEQVSSCYSIAKGETVSLTRTNIVTNSAFFKSFK